MPVPWFTSDLAVDLGTAEVLVFVRKHGVVVREPSVVAFRRGETKPAAVGAEAWEMFGRTPAHLATIRPLRNGVISEFSGAVALLKYVLRKAKGHSGPFRPRVVLSVPYGISELERRAALEAAVQAGARAAYLMPSPLAAAVGIGLPVEEPGGSLMVDVGAGLTEVGVLSLGGVVVSRTSTMAGDEIDQTIAQFVKRQYNVLIGQRAAEHVKMAMAAAEDQGDVMSIEVRGRDLATGLPRLVALPVAEIKRTLDGPFTAIGDTVKTVLEQTPPELAADIIGRGIYLTGGGALLTEIKQYLTQVTGIPVHVPERPLLCVVNGVGQSLVNLDSLSRAGNR